MRIRTSQVAIGFEAFFFVKDGGLSLAGYLSLLIKKVDESLDKSAKKSAENQRNISR